jgi:hypothetical protein
MSRAQDILDLIIDHLIDDERCPHMSRMAWTVKFNKLHHPINAIINETEKEARTDTIREIAID